jgi:hypothetical protein
LSRYFIQTANLPLYVEQLWGDESFKPSLIASDHEATNTGLLDHRGNKIMRAPNPVGFTAKL